MKIQIADIPEEGLHVDLKETFKLEEISLLSPVAAEFEVDKKGTEIMITGRISADAELQCGRCLKVFKRNIVFPVEAVYHPVEELGTERHELKDEEMDMGFYKGEEIDLDDFVREQLLLNVQMKPLCTEECKGLCPNCGADLNVTKCLCEKKEVDPRLEVLKNLLEKRKE